MSLSMKNPFRLNELGRNSKYGIAGDDEAECASWPAYFNPSFLMLIGAEMLSMADGQIYGASMKAFESTLGVSPSTIGTLDLVKAVASAGASPLWAHFADKCSRGYLIGIACMMFGTVSIACGISSTTIVFAILVVLNSMVLTAMSPINQSLVADFALPAERSRYFAILYMAGEVACICCSIIITPISQTKVFGMLGWRVAFFFVGLTSIAYSAIVLQVFTDPRNLKCRESKPAMEDFMITLKTVLSCKTWAIICFQGIFGSIPYTALHFLVLWLQYLGFSALTAGSVVACMGMGRMFGAAAAGVVGDWASVRSPDYGRVFTVVLADIFRPVLLLVLLVVLPETQFHTASSYMVIVAAVGFLMPWPAVACSKPIFTEVVPQHMRASIVAYQAVIERSFGGLGSFAVGYASETYFGYNTKAGVRPIGEMTLDEKAQNASALGNSLILTTVIPWVLCTLLYCFVLLTYKHDRDRALRAQQQP